MKSEFQVDVVLFLKLLLLTLTIALSDENVDIIFIINLNNFGNKKCGVALFHSNFLCISVLIVRCARACVCVFVCALLLRMNICIRICAQQMLTIMNIMCLLKDKTM